MRQRLASSIAGVVLVAACAAPHPAPGTPAPRTAGASATPIARPSAPAPRLTYNPAQWPDPLDGQWLGGTWALVAAVPGPQLEPDRYFLDFGREVLVVDEDGSPLTWLGGLDSVEWSDPRGAWRVRLDAPAPCGPATYTVTIAGGLVFIPIEESCRERFGILVLDAWNRPRPTPT